MLSHYVLYLADGRVPLPLLFCLFNGTLSLMDVCVCVCSCVNALYNRLPPFSLRQNLMGGTLVMPSALFSSVLLKWF